MTSRNRRSIAVLGAWGVLLAATLAWSPPHLLAQQSEAKASASIEYSHNKAFPNVLAPYFTPYVAEPRMSNSERIHRLIREGKLRLSLDDAIALALENNLDIALARYSPVYAQTDLLRTRSGGSTRGINPALFGAVTAFGLGGGGGGGGGTGAAGGVTGGGGATNIGTISCCDPVMGFSLGWDHRTSPLNFTVVEGVPSVTTQTTNSSLFVGQGFLTGTTVGVALSGLRQSSTSLNTLFNPEVPTGFTLGFNQRLLNGFGYRANARFIRIAQNDVKTADSVFRQQVMLTVSQILNLYSDLLFFRENVRVAQEALNYAQKLLSDNRRQVEIGTLAPIEVVRAESEVAARQQELIVAQTSYQQQQELLKTALSKQVDAELASAEIEATDQLPEPQASDVPQMEEALRLAAQNRPEIEQADLNIRSQEITVKANRNALLPSLNLFGSYVPTGLSGNRFNCPTGTTLVQGLCQAFGQPPQVPTVTSAGLFQSLTQTFHGNFPDYSFGITLSVPLRNRSAQADAATALLQEHQLQTQLQKTKNQVAQEVRNAEIALTQAKAQIEAAQKSVVLAQQTLDAEQKKFKLGESTVFLVIQAQRDLATAEGNQARARSTYAKALTQVGQATGTTLDKYHIEIGDAKDGHVSRTPNIPGTPAPAGGESSHQGL